MENFTITLGSKEYKVSSNNSNGKDERNYLVDVSHGNVRTTINFPMTEKLTRAKVMLFIEAFHEAMKIAFDAQKLDQNYIWNQKTTIS